MINNGDNRKEKRIISEPTPVDLMNKDLIYYIKRREFTKAKKYLQDPFIGICHPDVSNGGYAIRK